MLTVSSFFSKGAIPNGSSSLSVINNGFIPYLSSYDCLIHKLEALGQACITRNKRLRIIHIAHTFAFLRAESDNLGPAQKSRIRLILARIANFGGRVGVLQRAV